MNRFLAGLIDRAEGRAPVLQRRPRALFEPEGQGGVRPVETFEQTEMQDRSPRSRVESPKEDARPSREPKQREAHTESDRNRHSAMVTRRDDTGDRATRAGDDARHRGALQPDHVPPIRTRIMPTADADPTPKRSTPREPAVDRPGPPAPAVQRAPKEERQPKRLAAPVAEQRVVIQRETRTEVPTTATRPTIVERVTASPSMRPNRATPRDASRSAVLLAKAHTSPQIRRERPAPAAPVPVQVTIGRVEVRAVATKADRARTSAPAGPRLSLDEYLRQRNGASR